MPTIIISLIVFGLIVFVHEFGHYIIAKATGVRVEEFSLGMGPKIIGVTKGETVYSLRALPLGGFCKMTGENVLEEEENQKPDSKRFDTKPLWARFAIVVAGPVMNFLLAIVLFALIFTTIGIPVDNTIIGEVLPGHVAKIADIRPGDKITEINGVKVNGWSDVTTIIHNSSGKKLLINIERGTQRLEKIIVPKYDKENKMGLIGITPKNVWERKGIFEGIAMGYQDTYDVFKAMFNYLFQIATKHASTEDITGPVGIFKIIGEQARMGLFNLGYLSAVISINLGFMNLLPIPALDGGRLLFFVIEGIRRKKINPRKEGIIHFIGFALLLTLMIFVTWKDIVRYFIKG